MATGGGFWVAIGVSTTFTPYVGGDITIEIEIGPNYSDSNNGDNAATRVLEVGQICIIDKECGLCEKCESGSCVFQEEGEDIKGECPDGECTTEYCNGFGTCGFEPEGTPCDDGLYCTEVDQCQIGQCIGSGDPCLPNICDEEGDQCLSCPADEDCDDGVECTDDTCDPIDGCANTPNDANCDDSNICTDDFCDALLGCQNDPNSDPCDDGIYCNGDDTCSGGTCSDHDGDPCDDGNTCTDDTCNEGTDSCENKCNALVHDDPCCEDPACTDVPICAAEGVINGSSKPK